MFRNLHAQSTRTRSWRCLESPSEIVQSAAGLLLTARLAGESRSSRGDASLLTGACWHRVRNSWFSLVSSSTCVSRSDRYCRGIWEKRFLMVWSRSSPVNNSHWTYFGVFSRVISQARYVSAFAVGATWMSKITLRVHPGISDDRLDTRSRWEWCCQLLFAFSDDTYVQ